MATRRPTLTRTIAVPQHPAVDEARRRVDTLRDHTGRAATVAATAATITVMAAPGLAWESITATAVVTLLGTGIMRLSAQHAGHQKATATVLHLVPGVGYVLLETALYGLAACGVAWSGLMPPLQMLGITAWTAFTWLARPAQAARHMVTPRPPARPKPAPAVPARRDPMAQWWADKVAAATGPKDRAVAPGTVLDDIRRTGPKTMTAIIRSTTGKAVPPISIKDLSGLLDVPEDLITVDAVAGRGAQVRRLTVGPKTTPQQVDLATVWATDIAPKAMPRTTLTKVRVGKPGASVEHITTIDPTPRAETTADYNDDPADPDGTRAEVPSIGADLGLDDLLPPAAEGPDHDDSDPTGDGDDTEEN